MILIHYGGIRPTLLFSPFVKAAAGVSGFFAKGEKNIKVNLGINEQRRMFFPPETEQ